MLLLFPFSETTSPRFWFNMRINGHISLIEQNFLTFISAYLYFISFMYVEETHRHPVLLVFCDTLLEKYKIKSNLDLHEVIANVPNSYSTFDSTSTIGRSLSTLPRARLRWLKAYTLVRNPGLVKDDDHGFEKIGHIGDLSNGSLPQTLIM